MRAFFLGMLGALVALLIVGAVGAFALISYGRGAASRDRAELLRQIDDYEAWRNQNPVIGSFVNDFARKRDSFLVQREYDELRRYRSWWIATKQTEGMSSRWSAERLSDPLPEQLREPAMLDRYLTRRP